jgi:plasmid stability protein
MCQMCEEYEAELRRMGIAMDNEIVISDLEPETVEALERQARLHGHSVDQEVKHILRQGVTTPIQKNRAAQVEELRAFRASLPPQKTDSLTLLREDRDR